MGVGLARDGPRHRRHVADLHVLLGELIEDLARRGGIDRGGRAAFAEELAGAATEVVDFAEAPPRAQGQIVTDEGDGGAKIAEFLASKKFV